MTQNLNQQTVMPNNQPQQTIMPPPQAANQQPAGQAPGTQDNGFHCPFCGAELGKKARQTYETQGKVFCKFCGSQIE